MAEENREEKLDKAGRALLRSATADNDTLEKVGAAPFLYARIRARVAAEKARPGGRAFRPLLMLVTRQAIPALTLIAVIAASFYFFSGTQAPQHNDFNTGEAVLTRLEQNTPPTACNIANRSECVVSTDDVVAILVYTGGKEVKSGK